MTAKIQPLFNNTLLPPNTNKRTNESSKNITNTASKLRNNAEPCPIVTKNKVCFSEFSQKKEFVSEDTKLQKTRWIKTSLYSVEAKELQKTAKKTVHLKQLEKLNKKVTNIINAISFSVNNIKTKNSLSNKSPFFENVSNELKELTNDIFYYKNEISRSSYKHHQSKSKILDNLDKKIDNGNETLFNFQYELTKHNEDVKKGNKSSHLKMELDTKMKVQRQQDYKNEGHK